MITPPTSTTRHLLLLGAVAAMSGVLLGAFGAHGLRRLLDGDMLAIYETGVRYHLVHALGVLLIAILTLHLDSRLLRLAAACLLAGIVLFSGSLYALALSGVRQLGMVTPLGGLAFVLGWGLLFASVRRWS